MSSNAAKIESVTTSQKDVCDGIEKHIESITSSVDENIVKLKLEEQIIDLSINDTKANENDKQISSTKCDASTESIYATPLRKLDRPKAAKPPIKHSDETKTTINEELNGAAEDRHILNFLKDTTKLQKKLQRSGCGSGNNSSGDSEYGKANFSSLVQEQHFVNLVQQNVIGYNENVTHETDSMNTTDDASKLNSDIQLIDENGKSMATANDSNDILPKINDVFIKREWIIKLIALCLEQRLAKQTVKTLALGDEAVATDLPKKPNSGRMQQKQTQYSGVMLLGSNGSGKTSICKRIIHGNTGTQGMLNRKLLSCYFINAQNLECHSLSTFIRCIVMQILSHSTQLSNKDENDAVNQSKNSNDINISSDASTVLLDTTLMDTTSLLESNKTSTEEDEKEKVQLENDKCEKVDVKPTKMLIQRQKSETKERNSCNRDSTYDTYPPSQKITEDKPNEQCSTPNKTKTVRVGSKIPVKIGMKSTSAAAVNATQETPTTTPIKKSNEHKKSISNEVKLLENNSSNGTDEIIQYENIEIHKKSDEPKNDDEMKEKNENEQPELECEQPQPPPKTKSCLQMIADEYYTILTQTPEIMDSLNADNIEKNPDECFKKAILYPFLELQPPKSALLFLVDSIDEHYINEEENVISTLKGNSTNKSRTIAELLSNNFHLMPKWLFLVCTAKRQNRHIVKKFTGFKRIALDDLRKSHVVKDVQEYIIARLNADFKGQIHFSADIIDCLNQLYIKSNGSILYLEKVLSGIRENVFSFREIKLIPCTLNGLYLYICQKSFNKKQYSKIRPILNVLLASSDFIDMSFILNCLRTLNYTIDQTEFDKRIDAMKYILAFNDDETKVKIFHNSFSDWLSDVKFSTKKFLCSVNEGHAMISMYYTLVSDTLCPNQVLRYFGHLIKCDEYAKVKSINLDLILILLESKANLVDCFYVNALNCCGICELDYKQNYCTLPRMQTVIDRYLNKSLTEDVLDFIGDFFKPSLPTNTKVLKLLIETGINNADCQFSYDSLINSPVTDDNNDELARLLLNSEKSCQRNNSKDAEIEEVNEYQEIVSPPLSPINRKNLTSNDSCSDEIIQKHQLLSCGKALIHLLANDGNVAMLHRALNACKKDGNGLATIDLEVEDECGQTALNIAARNGHYDIVELLLSLRYISTSTNQIKHVNVNHADRDGWTPVSHFIDYYLSL